MSATGLLVQLAEKYRSEGYAVTLQPGDADLPDFLAGAKVDLLATSARGNVVAVIRRPEELTDLAAVAQAIDSRRPAWRLDAVVVPTAPQGNGQENGAGWDLD